MPNIIKIPEELAIELDLLAKRRTTYVVDVLWRDVRRNKQRQALAQGGAAYVETMRFESDERFEDAIARNAGPTVETTSR